MNIASVISNNRAWLVMAVLLMAALVLPMDAFASSSSDMPYENGLNILRESITGPVAFTISVIGVVAAGAMLIFGGDMNGFMRSMVFLILVIGLIVSAAAIMEKMFGKSAAVVEAGSSVAASLMHQGLC
ncbi:TrbC/VirB2 family protein [Stenotrophomonas rhizophila]|uniref:TrbC/VirB2 family protein n=1 Tax=Stenotrophomonas rhizophila TaxID=216778 RepID=UPI001E2B742E|nr:TrbC/VirB2 family protein [Stenotrophomonas rhizophila]MCC7634548.1 TrbC/VirB2 family protein [Stenotrophomonas rhizophila]MCC7664183.1 TrbC/VirB2 family protein [Stenotrophomonas rhizophila]